MTTKTPHSYNDFRIIMAEAMTASKISKCWIAEMQDLSCDPDWLNLFIGVIDDFSSNIKNKKLTELDCERLWEEFSQELNDPLLEFFEFIGKKDESNFRDVSNIINQFYLINPYRCK